MGPSAAAVPMTVRSRPYAFARARGAPPAAVAYQVRTSAEVMSANGISANSGAMWTRYTLAHRSRVRVAKGRPPGPIRSASQRSA